ncbi:MAG: NAD(P)/FAD-dependent oxidoreductase [Rhodothermia bacterium]|nr:NAD(P)/FAD-dependent oxidoreductase [Rhodothermia bacterium]
MAYDYDVITIGGGAAGLTASGLAATLGASALMVESERLGGDCTWYGCVPSKTILKAAKVAHQIQDAGRYGLHDGNLQFSFADLMAHIHRVREEVYEDADRPEIYENLGITVQTGLARFVDEHTIEVDGPNGARRYSGRYIVIATGAKAFVPPIKGIDSVEYLTNESLFELAEQPERLAIVGGGPIGTEMAQAFTRLGTKVTVVDMLDRILSKDHTDASTLMQSRLEDEGVAFELGAGVRKVARDGKGIVLTLKRGADLHSLEADALLMATGRRANTSALNLEVAGVETHRGGIRIDDRCRTSQRHIYAVGDVTGEFQFTHMSEHMSKIAMTNALLKIPMKIDRKHVPWVTFTDPEVGHVGASEQELADSGRNYRTYRFPYSKVDRAVTESEANGFIRVYAKPSSGKILGADVVGASAGELISEFALAMKNGVSLRRMSDTIHPYPTYGLGARRAADQWYVQKQSPTLVRILKTIFRYRGPVLEFGPDDIL